MEEANRKITKNEVYIVEPFYGGSHKQLIDFLLQHITNESNVHLYTLPDKKWHWRARTSALYFAQNIPKVQINSTKSHDLEGQHISKKAFLFCSSVLNLTELISLRSDLAEVCKGRKIIYFHENQLAYPIQNSKGDRDFQYGYNQVLSALTADKVIFNSNYNRTSFLNNLASFFKLQPDYRPMISDLKSDIEPKSTVLYFPIDINFPKPIRKNITTDHVLHIVWPHRWEHDKNPSAFFECLFKLQSEGHSFNVSVLGEKFTEVPPIFEKAKHVLAGNLLHFGRVENKEEYLTILSNADVVVSTAHHDFFGVAVVEAAICGCYPLVPQRLVYPEIFDNTEEIFSYRTDQQMFKKLRDFCVKPHLPRTKWTF